MHVLPDDLVIPPAFVAHQPDYSDWQPARVYCGEGVRIGPYIETPEGTLRIDNIDDFLDAISRVKHTFVICRPGEFDTLLKWFQREEIFAMYYGLSIEWKGWTVRYRGASITFQRGNTRHYIWNLYAFFKLKYDQPPNMLEAVHALVTLLQHHFVSKGISFSSLASPASVSRHLLLKYSYREFFGRSMDKEILQSFYAACHGGRQESNGVGTQQTFNYDMRNAHLGIIEQMLSIRGCQVREDFPYIEESRYGSYLITVDIPEMDFCPLPVELGRSFNAEIVHPYGRITNWYAKPYIELLIELGIPFKLQKSYQYVPVKDSERQPYKRTCQLIRDFLRESPDYINSKTLYWGLAGSTISWRWVANPDLSGELIPQAFNVFQPIFYSHVLSMQNVKMFREISKTPSIAIRSDAITTKNRIFTTMRREDAGEMMFITPLFKSFPSGRGNEWKDLVKEFEDKPYFDYSREDYPTVSQYLNRGEKLGKLRSYTMRVKPHHGKRLGMLPQKIGSLFDNWYPSHPISTDSLKNSSGDI